VANPTYPGIVGRLRAKLAGRELPPPRLPASLAEVCKDATERPVFVRAAGNELRRFKPLRHCTGTDFTTLYREVRKGEFEPVPFAEAPPLAFVRLQGFQLVPAELSELWGRDPRPQVLGVRAVVPRGDGRQAARHLRQRLALADPAPGPGHRHEVRLSHSTYFIGRYFGIVTPSTMGLDAWRLYETARLTRRPIECTTALAVERVIGLVGLLVVILLFMPFAGRVTQGESFGEMIGAMKVPLAGTMLFGLLVLLQPSGSAACCDWCRPRGSSGWRAT
jgi:hypothetical protein